tara:strand:+ start:77 stop:484 length:408 start_codon:yes stop_codon:yes gene_type:complete
MLTGIHNLTSSPHYGDWRIPSISTANNLNLYLEDISHLLTEDKLQELDLDDIAWKGRHLPESQICNNCICCGGKRYQECDVSYPGIVVETIINPFGKKYRMLDGKHRIMKLREQGVERSMFYVLEYKVVKNYFKN